MVENFECETFRTWEDYTELEQNQSEFSDYHKSVHGWRPRFIYSWDLERFAKEFKILAEESEFIFAAEEAREKEDIEEFKSLIKSTIDLGAENEETALRWITQVGDFYSSQDVESFVWDKGILFTDFGRQLVIQLNNIVTFKELDTA